MVDNLLGIEFALLLLALVRIRVLSAETHLRRVVDGNGGPSTFTAIQLRVAVKDLLGRQLPLFTIDDTVRTFEHASSSKSPVRLARTLVSHGGNNALVDPVDIERDEVAGGTSSGSSGDVRGIREDGESGAGELFDSQIRKRGNTERVGMVLCVFARGEGHVVVVHGGTVGDLGAEVGSLELGSERGKVVTEITGIDDDKQNE